MGLAVERLPLTLHWKKLYISGRSNDNENLLGIDYGRSHIVALQRSSERRKTKQGEERHQPFPLLTDEHTTASRRVVCDKIGAYFIVCYLVINEYYAALVLNMKVILQHTADVFLPDG